jgi:hypothetical protein
MNQSVERRLRTGTVLDYRTVPGMCFFFKHHMATGTMVPIRVLCQLLVIGHALPRRRSDFNK